MNAICYICSDLFDEINQLSAAACGHVYHNKCLKKLAEKFITCPQCQVRSSLRSVRKLYFDFKSESDRKPSEMENEIAELTKQLKAKDKELQACKRKKEKAICKAEKLVSDMQEYTSKLVNEKYELHQKMKFAHQQILQAKKIMTTFKNVEASLSEMGDIVDSALKKTRLSNMDLHQKVIK